MARCTSSVLIATAAGLSGCLAGKPLLISEPVGPVQFSAKPEAGGGELVVYSGWNTLDTLDSDHLKHTPYTIRPEQGGSPIRVRNRRGSFEEEPDVVRLEPGQYWVEAQGTNVGSVQVPVVVRRGETTFVYLDGVTAPPDCWRMPESNWVRQPDGPIVGWRDLGNAPSDW